MSEQKIETRLDIDPDKAMTAKFIEPKYSQPCLLCDNAREISYNPMHTLYPWVCDECKGAMVYIKEFKKTLDELLPAPNNNFEEPSKNVHPL